MFSFDLSTMNILLVATVVALFVVFVLVLMKLNPSIEAKERRETETRLEKEKPLQMPESPRQTLLPSKPPEVRANSGKPLTPLNPPVKIPPPIQTQTRQEPPAPVRSEIKEIPKQEKAMPPVKTALAPTRKDCLHHYGYLHSLPKNAPIPDECFGCPKIVDCLVSSNSNSNSKKRGG
jgi:Ca2+/Na+ antiporter